MPSIARYTLVVVLACAVVLAAAPLGIAADPVAEVFAVELPGEDLVTSPVTATIGPSSSDYHVYNIELAAGQVFDVSLDADVLAGDLDLYLYGPEIESVTGFEVYLAASQSTDSYPETISYLVPPDGGGTHYVVVRLYQSLRAPMDYTLTWSVGTSAAHRLAGPDRYSTSIAISRSTFASSDVAVLATGAGYPDALSASALAGVLDAPLLLVRDNIEAQAYWDLVAELERLGVSDVYVVGGTAAISNQTATHLSDTLGFGLTRLGGDTRYDTARRVADEVARLASVSGAAVDAAFLVRGDDFADALASAPYAFSQTMPVLLTRSGSLDPSAAGFIEANDVLDVTVVGGPVAVSAEVAAQAAALNGGATVVARIQGGSRYETAANLAVHAVAERQWATWGSVGIATGRTFPDALSGSTAAGRRGGVLLLTRPSALSEPASDAIAAAGDDVTMALVFGGPIVVSETAFDQIAALMP